MAFPFIEVAQKSLFRLDTSKLTGAEIRHCVVAGLSPGDTSTAVVAGDLP
jgi:hypothetical protein